MSNALTTQSTASRARTILDIIKSPQVREEVALALPKFLTPERMLRIAITTINRNPKLQECTPESLLSSLMQASQMGIEPDGRNGHLIPRWNSKLGKNECTFMADYKGLIGLVRKNGDVSDIYADLVCEADAFRITKGLHRDLIHEIDIRQPRGPILGAYAVIQYKAGGGSSFEFMTKEEIDAIRARSQSAQSGPWVSDYGEMAKKTVLKRLLKLADLSPDTAERANAEPVDVEATVTPSPFVTPRIEAAAALPAPSTDAPAVEKPAKARRTKLDPEKRFEPAPADDPLPGVAPVEAAATDSAADRFRAQHPGYTEAQLLTVLLPYNLADESMKSLDEISPARLEQALEDPKTIGEGLADPKGLAARHAAAPAIA